MAYELFASAVKRRRFQSVFRIFPTYNENGVCKLCANFVQVFRNTERYNYMKKNNPTRIILADGVYLMKDRKSGVYKYSYRIAGEQYRKSTRTKDLTTAKLLTLKK